MTKRIYLPTGYQAENPWYQKDDTSENAYAAGTDSVAYMRNFSKCLFHILNTDGANSLTYKAEGTIDLTNYEEIVAETVLAAGATGYETFTDAWRRIRIRIKSTVGGSHATFTTLLMKKA